MTGEDALGTAGKDAGARSCGNTFAVALPAPLQRPNESSRNSSIS